MWANICLTQVIVLLTRTSYSLVFLALIQWPGRSSMNLLWQQPQSLVQFGAHSALRRRAGEAPCFVYNLFMADKVFEWCLPWLCMWQMKYPICTSQLTQCCASLLSICSIWANILKKSLLRTWWKSKWFRAFWWTQGLVYNRVAKMSRSFYSSAAGV